MLKVEDLWKVSTRLSISQRLAAHRTAKPESNKWPHSKDQRDLGFKPEELKSDNLLGHAAGDE
jgi:hypothetical protein